MLNLAATPPWNVDRCRSQFPALKPPAGSPSPVFLDGPAGSQVPQCVADAVSRYLLHTNANHGGVFPTSQASDALLERAHTAVADFLGSTDPDCVAFGPNMTTLTFALSRALASTWRPGDEVLVTRLEHDANFTPWVLAARDAGATVRYVEIHRDDCTLNLDDLRRKLSPRTRLVAVGAASNAVGTLNPVSDIARWAHAVGALLFVDAVHHAPHRLIDVELWQCDFLVCSAYKFCGPHLGILWGRRELLASLPAYKLRTAPNDLPGKWMTGTQSHEAIAGALAAIHYLADLGRTATDQPLRCALLAAWQQITDYETERAAQFLAGMQSLPAYHVWGITQPERLAQRVPTFGLTHSVLPPLELARQLAQRGIYAWHGNFYALPLTEALGLEPHGLLRVGLLHYNTAAEVERLLAALAEIDWRG